MLKRYEGNPILKPNPNNWWEAAAVFNPAALCKDGKVHLFPRVIGEYENYISRIGHHVSIDRIHFEQALPGPMFGPEEPYDKWACEDPRVTEIEGTFYFTYVALSEPVRQKGGPPSTALFSTTDFRNFQRYGLITPRFAENKDVVLFPEKFDGRYAMLHRPCRWSKEWMDRNELDKPKVEIPCEYEKLPQKPSIWLAYSDDLKNWFDHKVVKEPQEWWELQKVGAGTPPIKTEAGWLVIYHGVAANCYRAGAVILDLKDPSKILSHSKNPILEPSEGYETKGGDVSNVVFPEGAVVIDAKLFVYYGAADKTIGLATCDLEELINNNK